MASSVNKVILIGNLGANPDLKYLPSGTAVCELRLATNDVYTDKQGVKQEKVEWHRVVVWGKVAENCSKYLEKGRAVYVEGRLQTRSWDDKEGIKRYITEIQAQQVQFLGGGGGEGGARGPSHGASGGSAGGAGGAAGGGGSAGGGGGGNAGAPSRGAPSPSEAPPDFGTGGGDDDIPF